MCEFGASTPVPKFVDLVKVKQLGKLVERKICDGKQRYVTGLISRTGK